MAKYTVYSRSSAALSRKEWLRQRRASKSDGAMVIVNRTGGESAGVSVDAVAGIGSGEQALSLLNELFERVNIGTEEEPVYAIRAKYGFFSDSFVSAGGINTTE